MAISKKNKPITVRQRPKAFIEGTITNKSNDKSESDVESESESESDAESIRELPADKMLLKLRMSNSRQLPVWTDATDTLWEKGFEASAKAAEAIAAALIRFRRILDAEAKIRDAEAARAELAILNRGELTTESANEEIDADESADS